MTIDWTQDSIEGLEGNELEERKMVYAATCAMGVAEADVFILLAHPGMAGAFVELGMAIAASIPVVILNAFKEGNPSCIFYHFPQCEAFQHLPSFEAVVKVMGGSSSPYDEVTKVNGKLIQLPNNN